MRERNCKKQAHEHAHTRLHGVRAKFGDVRRDLASRKISSSFVRLAPAYGMGWDVQGKFLVL